MRWPLDGDRDHGPGRGEIGIKEKTRFSIREKKILLFLRQNEDDGRQHIKKIFELDPIKNYRRELKDGRVIEYNYRSNDSIRRTLLGLRKGGYVKHRRGGRNWTFYKLTDKGREKADELNKEITAFIQEWQPLLSHGTDINA